MPARSPGVCYPWRPSVERFVVSWMVWLRVVSILLLIAANTLFHGIPMLTVAAFKALAPSARLRRACDPWLVGISERWVAVNCAMVDCFTRTRFEVDLHATLRADGHYLVLANHQTWVDIMVLHKVFNRRIPFQRFFLKRQLIWVPVIGLACWALDFPFMGRYTHRQIAKNPELGRRDMDATRRACGKFRYTPVSVMNFVEGTRFTPEKRAAQASPYRHLLKPKSGGVAQTVDVMGEHLHTLLDVTIVYPGGRPSMVDLLGDRIPAVQVVIRERDFPAELRGRSFEDDRRYRAQFQQWLNGVWEEKDAEIARRLG